MITLVHSKALSGVEREALTGCGTDELKASSESRFDHLASIDAAFGLAKVEEGVYRENECRTTMDVENGTYGLRR